MGDIRGCVVSFSESAGDRGLDSILHSLADRLQDVAGHLREAAFEPASDEIDTSPAPYRPEREIRGYLMLARQAYALRRKRAAIFAKPEMFGEPAWDILLDLYIAKAEGKLVSVSSACIGAAAPATTGLRWLGVLAGEGLVIRENDPEDHRRVMVRLTTTGLAAMERFFDAAEAYR